MIMRWTYVFLILTRSAYSIELCYLIDWFSNVSWRLHSWMGEIIQKWFLNKYSWFLFINSSKSKSVNTSFEYVYSLGIIHTRRCVNTKYRSFYSQKTRPRTGYRSRLVRQKFICPIKMAKSYLYSKGCASLIRVWLVRLVHLWCWPSRFSRNQSRKIVPRDPRTVWSTLVTGPCSF